MENRKIILSDNGTISVPDETKMSISEIADLFGIYYQTAKRLILAIERPGIVGGDYSMSCICDGSKVYPEYYGLEMIIAVAFRIRSPQANAFRQWITAKIIEKDTTRIVQYIDWNNLPLN